MDIKYPKLRGRIIEKYGNMKNFSERIGISETSMSLKMTGKRGFTQKNVFDWAEALDIDLSEVGDYFYAKSQTEINRGSAE
nr:MAG TPA: Protein of unknown function (DUF739) [Caudoviricetes sp.]